MKFPDIGKHHPVYEISDCTRCNEGRDDPHRPIPPVSRQFQEIEYCEGKEHQRDQDEEYSLILQDPEGRTVILKVAQLEHAGNQLDRSAGKRLPGLT